MEALAEKFFSSLEVDETPNSTSTVHPLFSEYYKCKGDTSNQVERRKTFLEAQRKKRKSLHNEARNIALKKPEDCMEWSQSSSKKIYCRKKHGQHREIKGILMQSEWLVDVPEDINSAWTSVVCPDGKRCVIVAQNRTTLAYDKGGHQFLSFPSWLPCGSKAERQHNSGKNQHRTVLDCIFNIHTKTFFVLDILEWSALTFLDCEASFRFFWLSSQLAEITELSVKSNQNPYIIKLAPRFPACELEKRMAQYPLLEESDPQVDGILFYHDETLYTSGSTPLVGWLKPFMIPEILKITINVLYLSNIPANYQNAQEFMSSEIKSRKNYRKIRSKHLKKAKQKDSESMIVSDPLEPSASVDPEIMDDSKSLDSTPNNLMDDSSSE